MAKQVTKATKATKVPLSKEAKVATKEAKARTKALAKVKREVHKASEGGSFDRTKLKTDWNAKQVKEARAKHHQVKVGKQVFGSVYKAFLALELPLWQHQAFRKVLKLKGKEAFTFKGKAIPFEVVK